MSEKRRTPVMSVEGFANRKGVVKGLQGFKARKETKRVQTAKALRQYQRVMKKEGYQPGRGASRKRNEEENGASTEQYSTTTATPSLDDDNNNDTKRPRGNRFQKALQQSVSRQEVASSRQMNERERQQKLRQRRQRTKQLRQRSSKGQPIMKHIVHDILHKLEQKDKDIK